MDRLPHHKMTAKVAPSSAIALAWDAYRSACVPKDAIPVQIRETRLGFYAGAAAALDLMFALAAETETDEYAAAARLESYRLELEAFGRSLMT